MTINSNAKSGLFRRVLTQYLSIVPLGSWPEYCVQDLNGRRGLLAKRSLGELLRQFWRTHVWYLRYAWQFVTSPLRAKPTFFLMGFPKCGTTYLANRLMARKDVGHPTSLAPLSKETFHYRKDQPIHAFMPIRGYYPMFSREKHRIDASVSYSLDPGAMVLVKKDNPDTKVILSVRDQVTTFVSGINYYNVRLWRQTPEELEFFNNPDLYHKFPMEKVYRAIRHSYENQCSIMKTMQSRKILDFLGDDAAVARRFTPLLYDLWVGFHIEVFGREKVHVVDFADLVSNPEVVVASVTDFLGMAKLDDEAAQRKRTFDKHTSQKVFTLQPEAKKALSDLFRTHNDNLKNMCGVDLNRHF